MRRRCCALIRNRDTHKFQSFDSLPCNQPAERNDKADEVSINGPSMLDEKSEVGVGM